MSYTLANLRTTVKNIISGDLSDTVFLEIANRSVRDLISRVDLRSSIRTTSLVPNMVRLQYEYQCPSDMKGINVIDIKPLKDRSTYLDWKIVTREEFDRNKATSIINTDGEFSSYYSEQNSGFISFSDSDEIRKLLITNIAPDEGVTLDTMESITNWDAYGDVDTVELSRQSVTGDGSVMFDINSDGGTTAGVSNDNLVLDIDGYTEDGQIFTWIYISDTSDITNFIIKIGTDSSNYYSVTATTNNEGSTWQSGWNLLRFNLSSKTTTGTVTATSITYMALYMTKDAGKTDETGYKFSKVMITKGDYYDVIYYSKYLWKNSSGTRLENATDDTDVLIADTDEIRLIETRTAMWAEKYLKNHNEARLLEESYNHMENGYQMFNPSQALTMITTYFDYGNIR
jgi:hypothetical protein